MSERITRDDVAHVARLARLELTDDELDAYTGQLAAVLDHAADVEALDLAGVAPTTHPLPAGQRAARRRGRADASTATRCWPRRPRPRTAASGCRRSWGRRRERARQREIAAAVRGRRALGASTCVEEHLAAHRRRARPRSTPSTSCWPTRPAPAADDDRPPGRGRRRPRPARRRARRPQGQPVHPGRPDHVLVAILEGWRPPYDATVVERLRRRRRGRHRQDQPRRVRHGLLHRELGVRADPQPPRPQPRAGRLERRQRGGGGRRLRAARARLATPAARSASPPRCAASSA